MKTHACGKDSAMYGGKEKDQNDKNRNMLAKERQNRSFSSDTHFSSIPITAKTMKGVIFRRIRRNRECRDASLQTAQAHISHSEYDIFDLYPAKKQSPTTSTLSPFPPQP